MIEIIRETDREKFYIEDMSGEKTILALLQEQGLFVSAFCNGAGSCGRCRVRFLTGAPVPTEWERRLLQKEELAGGIRLACAVHVKESCRILLPESGEDKIKVLTDDRLRVKHKQTAADSCRQQLRAAYGIAVDIGTTTLAAELFDLADGQTLALASGVNHQRAYGADVLTRIAAANAGKGKLLQASIRADISALICELIKQMRDGKTQQEWFGAVQRLAIVGNTTMCHLLRGLSCEGLGRAPFVPADNGWYDTDARTLLGMKHCTAKVTILPGISAFVGSDIVAGIFSSNMEHNIGKSLLLDIGTNGEMAFFDAGRLYVTSAAAGPVFEGGNISCGMPAIPGAICRVTCSAARYQEDLWQCETIDGQPPIGICGTGIIDLASVLLEGGYMDENGTLKEPWFTDGVPVAGDEIRFKQGDIRELQMGKSAIRTGIEILLEETAQAEPAAGKLTVFLAGGFGHFIDTEKAIRIGMFPPEFKGHFVSVGNSALKGAKKYLLEEKHARERLDRLLSIAEEWNLAERPTFEERYLKHMFF